MIQGWWPHMKCPQSSTSVMQKNNTKNNISNLSNSWRSLFPHFSSTLAPFSFYFIYWWICRDIIFIFFNWRTIALQKFVVSVKPQHESAIAVHISRPFWTSLPIPSLWVDTEPLFKFPEPYSEFLLAIYFTYGNMSFPVSLSIHLTLSSPLPMSISLFSMSVSPLLPCK